MSAPNDIMKSMYSLPSASQTREPWPRSRNTGPGENTAAPRDGELTPSTSDCWERSNHCCEFLRFAGIEKELHDSHGFSRIFTDQDLSCFLLIREDPCKS